MLKKFSIGNMLAAVCVGFAAALISFSAPVMLIPALALIGAFSFMWGTGYAAAALIFACIGILGANISNPNGIIFVFIPFLAASAALIGGFKRRLPYRYIAMLLALFALISLYGIISVPALMQGEPAYSAIIGFLKELETFGAETGMDISGFPDAISVVPVFFHGYLILIAEFIGFITVVLCKYFCSFGKTKPRPMAKFADWQLPLNLRIGIPVLAVVCIIAFIAHFKAADAFLFAVLAFILPVLTLQGTSFVVFMLQRGKKKKKLSVLSIILLILFLLLAPLFFTVFGLVDLYSRMRVRMRRYDKKIDDALEKARRTGSNTATVDFDDGEGPRIISLRKTNDEAFYDSDLDLNDDKKEAEDPDEAGSSVQNADSAGEPETGKEENSAESENTHEAADAQNVSGTDEENKAESENTPDTLNRENTEAAPNAENTENTDAAPNAENTENPDAAPNAENTGNTENAADCGKYGNTENTDNTNNTEI